MLRVKLISRTEESEVDAMVHINTLILTAVIGSVYSCGDFYWRNYNGIVPTDAIPAGLDRSKQLLFIGQAYMHGYGLMLGTIKPGSMEINVPCYGARRTDKMIKILCASDHRKYYWMSVTSGAYHNHTKERCPVLGGYDQMAAATLKVPVAPLHVGRTRNYYDVIIGNIAAYADADVPFYYPYNDTELHSGQYEVLVYNDLPYVFNHVSSVNMLVK